METTWELPLPCRFCNSYLRMQVTCSLCVEKCPILSLCQALKPYWVHVLSLFAWGITQLWDVTEVREWSSTFLRLKSPERLLMCWPRERLVTVCPSCVGCKQHFSNRCERVTFLFRGFSKRYSIKTLLLHPTKSSSSPSPSMPCEVFITNNFEHTLYHLLTSYLHILYYIILLTEMGLCFCVVQYLFDLLIDLDHHSLPVPGDLPS